MDIETLRARLRYDSEVGSLCWVERPITNSAIHSWNAKFAGTSAGRIDRHGRLYIRYTDPVIGPRSYQAHRLIWMHYYGVVPAYQIDHIDGNPLNNRITNLREATHAQNQQNRGPHKGSESGFKGVARHRAKWSARIYCDGKYYCLGSYETPEAASAVYEAKARELHGEFAYCAAD